MWHYSVHSGVQTALRYSGLISTPQRVARPLIWRIDCSKQRNSGRRSVDVVGENGAWSPDGRALDTVGSEP